MDDPYSLMLKIEFNRMHIYVRRVGVAESIGIYGSTFSSFNFQSVTGIGDLY